MTTSLRSNVHEEPRDIDATFHGEDTELSDTDDLVVDGDFKTTLQQAVDYKLPFGQYKGATLGECIKLRDRRRYLRYIAGWEKLRDPAKTCINTVLNEWKNRHNKEPKTQENPKTKIRKVRWKRKVTDISQSSN